MDRRGFLKLASAVAVPIFIPLERLDFGIPKQKLIVSELNKLDELPIIQDDYYSIGFVIEPEMYSITGTGKAYTFNITTNRLYVRHNGKWVAITQS